MRTKTLLILLMFLVMPGCQSAGGGSGVKWYNPGTWFSGKAGRESAAIEAKTDKAEDKALREAQKAVKATGEALAVAPDSLPVATAKQSNADAQSLLDQLAGPMTAEDAARVREQVRLLTSSLEEERRLGAEMRRESTERVAKISAELAKLAEMKRQNDADLAKAFERENSLANELRNERWWSWFWRITIGVAAVLALAGWVYVRLTLGGLPTALGKTLKTARENNPALAEMLTSTLDVNLSPTEQKLIRILTAKI